MTKDQAMKNIAILDGEIEKIEAYVRETHAKWSTDELAAISQSMLNDPEMVFAASVGHESTLCHVAAVTIIREIKRRLEVELMEFLEREVD